MKYSALEKFREIQRELHMRIKVYETRVNSQIMDARTAKRQIEIMQEIADDYRQLADKERLL